MSDGGGILLWARARLEVAARRTGSASRKMLPSFFVNALHETDTVFMAGCLGKNRER